MDKVLITANFHIFVGQGKNVDGTDKAERRAAYTKGMVVDITDVPEGHDASVWIDQGLASAA